MRVTRILLLSAAILASSATVSSANNAVANATTSGGLSPRQTAECPKKVTAAYYNSWAAYATGQFAIAPEDLNPDYYTHPLYAFAYIDPDTFFVEYADNELDKFVMSRFTSTLKNGNPCVHPMISVGGAAFTAADATRSVWSSMISRRSSRTAFITSAIAKARKFGFAGIDLDWEFPGDESTGGIPDDKVYLIPFLYEFRQAINAEAASTSRTALLLTLPIPCNVHLVTAGYDLPAIAPYLDWFHVMSYDYSGNWMSFTAAATPIFPYTIPGRYTTESIDTCVNSMLFQGISPDKIVLGVIAYGYGWKLDAPSTFKGPVWAKYGVDGSFAGAIQGPASKQSGVMFYSEFQALCWRRHITESPKSAFTLYGHSCATAGSQLGDLYIDKQSGVVYGIYDSTWFTFENLVTVSMKLALLGMRNLRGTFVWATTQDDASNSWNSSLQVEISTILGKMTVAPSDGTPNYHNISAMQKDTPFLLVQLTLNPAAVAEDTIYNLKSSVAVSTGMALPVASLHVLFTAFLNVSYTDDGVPVAFVECQVSSTKQLVDAAFLNTSLLVSRINYALAITTGVPRAVWGIALRLSLDSEKQYSELYDSGDGITFIHAPEVDDKTAPIVTIAAAVGGSTALVLLLAFIAFRRRRSKQSIAGNGGAKAPVKRPKPVPVQIMLDAKGTPIPPKPVRANRKKKANAKPSVSKDHSSASPVDSSANLRRGRSSSPRATNERSKSPRNRSKSPRSPREAVVVPVAV